MWMESSHLWSDQIKSGLRRHVTRSKSHRKNAARDTSGSGRCEPPHLRVLGAPQDWHRQRPGYVTLSLAVIFVWENCYSKELCLPAQHSHGFPPPPQPAHDIQPTSNTENSSLQGTSVSLPLMSGNRTEDRKCKNQRMGRSTSKCYLLIWLSHCNNELRAAVASIQDQQKIGPIKTPSHREVGLMKPSPSLRNRW